MVAAPWLNPFAPGPTPAAVPLLFSWVCATVLFAGYRSSPVQSLAGRLAPVAAWAWLVAGLLSSAAGLLQYFGGAEGFAPWISQSRPGEAFANLRQRNHFASLCNIALVALIWLAANSAEKSRKKAQSDRCWPWLLPLAAALLAAGNAASSSRTGLVQLVVLCGLFCVWGGLRHLPVRRVMLTAVLAYAAATLLLPWLAGFDLLGHGLTARIRAGDEVCVSRLTLWSNVLQLIAEKPWLGWGWGELDFAHYMTIYPGARFCDILDNAHNLPLHLAVELGIPVAVLVLIGSGWVLLRAKPWRETAPARQMAWGVLTVIMLHSMLEYPLWYGPFQMATVLCGVLLWPSSPVWAASFGDKLLGVSMARAGLATVLLGALCYAAWDYRRVSQIYLAPQARDSAYRVDTINKMGDSRLFGNPVRFAELTTTELTRDNAQWTLDTALALLHYSPEPRVIEKVIESAVMLGRDDDALLHLLRYRAAFPEDHEKWRRANTMAQPLGR